MHKKNGVRETPPKNKIKSPPKKVSEKYLFSPNHSNGAVKYNAMKYNAMK